VGNNSGQKDKDVSETNNLLARLHAETWSRIRYHIYYTWTK